MLLVALVIDVLESVSCLQLDIRCYSLKYKNGKWTLEDQMSSFSQAEASKLLLSVFVP